MKIQRLSSKGFSHHVMLLAFVVIFAVAGVGYLVASHAASPRKNCVRHTFVSGSDGPCVKDIQFAMGVKADGQYGPKTARAVRWEQKQDNITADGVVGK